MLDNEFRDILDDNENIVWSDKPHLLVHILSGVPFLIIGLIWGAIDFFFLNAFNSFGGQTQGFLLPFMLLHSAPFWLSIINMLRLLVTYRNTYFAITNKRVLTRTGFMGIDYTAKDFDIISNVSVNVNPIEKMLGRGSIIINEYTSVQGTQNVGRGNRLYGIANPYEIFKQLKSMSLDIKTDIQFPNKFRPDTNPGYNTKYDK
ncbi:MAG: PH domain-containing protein [Erysipelothrix sp.]|nr:PH domain-containing protein [Erysipelothrix sp.]